MGYTPKKLGHVNIFVRNAERAREWYGDLLGLHTQGSYDDTVMYASAFPCLMCAGSIVNLGIPKVVVGATWPGYKTSHEFMQSHGIKVVILELEACLELLRV